MNAGLLEYMIAEALGAGGEYPQAGSRLIL